MASLIRREGGRGDVGRPRQQEFSLDPFRVMESLLRWDPFRSFEGMTRLSEYVPSLDVKETKDAYVVRADLPGVEETDIEVNLSGNVLTISGEREHEQRDEGDQYFAMERSYGSFSRALTLPEGADAENVKAELKDGVLTVIVPKKPEVQPRRISIGKSGGEGKAKA